MRVITGTARGKKLNTLPGVDLRPTGARVKEGLFSAIQFDIEGRRVLDLFAGCGQLGIEALSRGAASAVFVDESAAAVNVIKENLKNCGLEKNSAVVKNDYSSYLSFCKETFDIVFIDPPYRKGLYEKALSLTEKKMSDFGMIICEYPSDVTLPESVGNFSVSRKYKYGKVLISIYKKAVSADE